MLKVVGHRGVKLLEAENSLVGFERALSLGVDRLELDVHLTSDGQVVVVHDEFVSERLFDWAQIKELGLMRQSVSQVSWQDLKSLKYSHKKSKTENVSLLTDVLKLSLKYPKAEWHIEVKYNEEGNSFQRLELVRAILDVVECSSLDRSAVIFYSFDVEILRVIRREKPNYRINFLYEGEEGFWSLTRLFGFEVRLPDWEYCHKVVEELQADVFAPHYLLLKWFVGWRKFFKKGQRRCEMYTWTVNFSKSYHYLIEQDEVDGIITDDPLSVQKAVKSYF